MPWTVSLTPSRSKPHPGQVLVVCPARTRAECLLAHWPEGFGRRQRAGPDICGSCLESLDPTGLPNDGGHVAEEILVPPGLVGSFEGGGRLQPPAIGPVLIPAAGRD